MAKTTYSSLEKIYIIFFSSINAILIAFPGLYSRQFGTLLDLLSSAQTHGLAIHSPTTLAVWSFILLFSSLSIIIATLLNIHSKKGVDSKLWYVYFFTNLFVLIIIATIYGQYFETIGLKDFTDKMYPVLCITVLIQLILPIILYYFQKQVLKKTI